MLSVSAAAALLAIIFLATLVRSAFGFGEALIAVPLLAFCLPLRVAVPLAVLLSMTIAGIVVVHDWKHIHFRSAIWLLLPTLAGIPLGLLLLASPHQQLLKFALGLLILLFAAYSLLGRQRLHLANDHPMWLLACGFLAGVLGGAYGMNGPPLVIYGSLRRWSAQHFRATLQAYFLPASLLAMAGYWRAGLWTSAVSRDYLLALPAMLPAVFLGRTINRRLSGEKFLNFVYVGLGFIGAFLMSQSL